jgi:phosphate transport system substrate-binding protein
MSLSFALAMALSHSAARAQNQVIKVDGSSTVFPVTEAVAEDFQAANKGVKVTVGISGTGGGFKKFVRGETDVQNASRPILKAEMEQAKTGGIEYIEIPICYDALTVAVHPSNNFIKQLTVEQMKKMWEPSAQGVVTKWNQIDPSWPDAAMKLFGAGSDSGTFDYFTEAIVGKAKSSRGDYTGSEDDNTLVQGIAGDKHALGYLPFAYYTSNAKKLKAVPIVNKAGKAVLPSMAAVKDGSYEPLSRPLFIYINVKAMDRPEVAKFVDFYVKHAAKLAEEVKYLPLPDAAYKAAADRLAKKVTGSAFKGEPEIGVTVEALLKRETTK